MRKRLLKSLFRSITTFLICTAILIDIPSIGAVSNGSGDNAPLNDRGSQAELYD